MSEEKLKLVAAYLASGIMERGLDYDAVVARYPQLKAWIDEYLEDHGWKG